MNGLISFSPSRISHVPRTGPHADSFPKSMQNPPQIVDELRAIALPDLLRWQGLEPQREGQSFRAKNGDHNIVVTGHRWYDNAIGAGGAGAIDLYMHLTGAHFVEACSALSNAFPARIAYQGFTHKPHREPTKTDPKRVPFHLLIARYATRDDDKWPAARHYLVHTRGISAELADRMHGEGLIYANNHSPLPSLVFLHRTFDGGVAGATLRDIVEGSRFCPSLGDKLSAWFSVGNVETASKIVAVESPIDALSYHCLRPDLLSSVAVVSCGGTHVPEELMGKAYQHRKPLALALDNDLAGIAGTRRAQERVSGWEDFAISVERPQRKDWNEDLAAIRTAQVASLRESPSIHL